MTRFPRNSALIFITFIFLSIILYYSPASAQWSPPVRISEPGGCSYPQILAIGDTLHVVYTNERGGDKISYVQSADGGESWSQYQVLSDTLNTELSQLPRVIRSAQRLMATWASYNSPGVYHYNIAYSISNNNGLTWSGPDYVFEQNREEPLTQVAVNDDSVINIIMGTWTGDSVGIFNVRSTNFGQTWSLPRPIFNISGSGWRDCVSYDSLVHLSWSGRYDLNHRTETYYTRSVDAGVNWDASIALSDTDQHHSQLPSIAVNGAGTVVTTWMDFKYAPSGSPTGDIFLRLSPDSGNSWNPINELFSNHFAFRSDVAANGDTIHIAWEDEGHGAARKSIYYVESADNGQSWSEPYWLDATLDDSKYPAMAVSNGRVHAVWAEFRQSPESSGVYFTRWPFEPDAIDDNNEPRRPERASITAYPNPFNSRTTISYSSAKGGEIGIYNSIGQLVSSFEVESGGAGKVIWDGTDIRGKKVASGAYFVRLHGEGGSREIKLIYLK